MNYRSSWQTVWLTMAAQTEILLSLACLQLRIYYLFEASAPDLRKEALIKSYHASLVLISKVDIADTHSSFVKFAPNHFSHILGMAAILVMKIVNSSYSQYIDLESGRRAFNTVLSLMRKCSIEDNDLKGRMSKILAQLWGVHRSDPARRDQPPSLTIKSRFCASILHDSLWLWRERFGGQAYTGAPPPPPPPSSPPPVGPVSTLPPLSSHPPPLDTSPGPHSLPPGPAADFISHDAGTQLPQDHLGPLEHLTYRPNDPSADYLYHDLDMAQEEHNWMWNVGFPSVLPGNLDFYPTTSALDFTEQNQAQQ